MDGRLSGFGSLQGVVPKLIRRTAPLLKVVILSLSNDLHLFVGGGGAETTVSALAPHRRCPQRLEILRQAQDDSHCMAGAALSLRTAAARESWRSFGKLRMTAFGSSAPPARQHPGK